jgi:CHAD domain-containing protein
LAAPNFTVQPHDATGSAARSAIAFYVRALITEVPGAQRGEAEPVHQLRITARRVRSAVRLFAPYISAIRPREIDERVQWLGKQAGAVRDLDVLEKLLQKRAKKLDPQITQDLEPLFEEVRVRRAKAAETLAVALASRRYKLLVAKLSAPIAITSRGDVAFGSVAGELFVPMLKAALRAGVRMHEDPAPDELHRLRKRAKRTRYALEMMVAIDEKQLRALLTRLEALQDVIGGYHDGVVALNWIKEFVASHELPGGVAFACGALAQTLQRSEQKLKRRGLREWRRCVKTEPDRIVKKALEKVQPKGVSSDDALPHAPRPRRRAHA